MADRATASNRLAPLTPAEDVCLLEEFNGYKDIFNFQQRKIWVKCRAELLCLLNVAGQAVLLLTHLSLVTCYHENVAFSSELPGKGG